MKNKLFSISVLFVTMFFTIGCQKEEISFDKNNDVTDSEEVDDGIEYVDLGLSVKWATKNVGAKKASDWGNFFAWGEISPKNQYDWTTYKYSVSGATQMTKYSVDALAAIIDGRIELDPSDDAATVNVGNHWRIPTLEEMNELGDKCKWSWTNNYKHSGKSGYIVTSKVEGFTDKSIFLPAAGHMGGKSHNDEFPPKGMYWTSSLDYNSFASINAVLLYFEEDSYSTMSYDRQIGMTIRPVLGTGEFIEHKLPFFMGSIESNTNSTWFIASIRMVAITGYPLTDYGWEFSFDENFTDVVDSKTFPLSANPVVTYDPVKGILQIVVKLKYIMENYSEAYIRAYASCSEGTVYAE